ncbi:MAG TPA: head-tail adaptor protein [Cerasibacillus sp.]
MIKFEFKKKRINSGDLRTPVVFYEYAPIKGPDPGEKEKRVLYECFAKVETVWAKDLEQAKTTGTVEDLTISIRDPRSDYRPNNKHYVEIDDIYYRGKRYNIKHVQPDLQNKDFIKVIAGVES